MASTGHLATEKEQNGDKRQKSKWQLGNWAAFDFRDVKIMSTM